MTLGALLEGLLRASRGVLGAPWAVWIAQWVARGPRGPSCGPSRGRPCLPEAVLRNCGRGLPSSAVFRRLPPAFRPWPGPCPGGSPPRPPQGDTKREPLRQVGEPDIATNPDLGREGGVTCEQENSKEEDAHRAHDVGSRVVRLRLWRFVGASPAILGPSWGVLGPSWEPRLFEASRGLLEASWGPPWASLAVLGRSWPV